jgi:hypothetical protein
MSSRPRSGLEQSRQHVIGAVIELDRFDVGEARGAFDAYNRDHTVGEAQIVIGVVAGENGNVGAGTAIDLVGARSAVDRVVAIFALT